MRSGECGCCLGLLCARRSPTIAPPTPHPPLFPAALFGIARGEANPAVAARHVGMPSAVAARGAAPQSDNEMNDPRELAARSYYASRNLRLADDPFAQALTGAPAYACPPARASAAPRAGSGPPARASAAHFAAAAPARASAAHSAAAARRVCVPGACVRGPLRKSSRRPGHVHWSLATYWTTLLHGAKRSVPHSLFCRLFNHVPPRLGRFYC